MNPGNQINSISKVSTYIQKQKFKIVLITPIILMFGHLEKRPLNHEGGQSYVRNLADKVDFWGSILPIITPYKTFKAESFLISVSTVLIFLIGSLLILRSTHLSGIRLVIFLILFFVGCNFVIANSRDSFALSFAILNFGLILIYKRRNIKGLLVLIIICLSIMVSFRFLTAIAIVMLLILFNINQEKSIKKIIPIPLFIILIIVTGIVLDKGLARLVNLEQSYPEQMPIYQDLASFYCWSDDPSTRQLALKALKPVIAAQTPSDICLTLRPNSWAYLTIGGNFIEQGVKAPLVLISEDNAENLSWIRSGWIKTIIADPVDYIQFKLISATQIITVGNPFKYPLLITDGYYEDSGLESIVYELPDLLSKTSFEIWRLQHLILSVIGSTYIFSIPFLFLILIFCQIKLVKFKLTRNSIVIIMFCHILNVILLSVGFVSDEARYVFPIIFLTYLFALIQEKSTLV